MTIFPGHTDRNLVVLAPLTAPAKIYPPRPTTCHEPTTLRAHGSRENSKFVSRKSREVL